MQTPDTKQTTIIGEGSCIEGHFSQGVDLVLPILSMTMPTTINEPMVDGIILLDSQSKTLPGYTVHMCYF